MKALLTALLMLGAIGILAACGGGAPPEPAVPDDAAAESQPSVPNEGAEESTPQGEPSGDQPADEEVSSGEGSDAAESSGDDAVMVAGRPASGVDPDTGLEINPPEVVPGVDFIVRGEIVTATLTPQDSPEFVIIAPSGTRYRIEAQPVPDIFFEDGSQPKPHEYSIGLPVQATVRQEIGAGATIVVQSSDLTLLLEE